MKSYIEFEIELKNGSKCTVRYCKLWSGNNQMKGCLKCKDCIWSYRVDHFEFRDNLYISPTGYKSHFVQPEYDYEYDPIKASIEMANELADFKIDIMEYKSSQLNLF